MLISTQSFAIDKLYILISNRCHAGILIITNINFGDHVIKAGINVIMYSSVACSSMIICHMCICSITCTPQILGVQLYRTMLAGDFK